MLYVLKKILINPKLAFSYFREIKKNNRMFLFSLLVFSIGGYIGSISEPLFSFLCSENLDAYVSINDRIKFLNIRFLLSPFGFDIVVVYLISFLSLILFISVIVHFISKLFKGEGKYINLLSSYFLIFGVVSFIVSIMSLVFMSLVIFSQRYALFRMCVYFKNFSFIWMTILSVFAVKEIYKFGLKKSLLVSIVPFIILLFGHIQGCNFMTYKDVTKDGISNSVTIKDGKIVLLRKDGKYAALIPIKQIIEEDIEYMKYQWYYFNLNDRGALELKESSFGFVSDKNTEIKIKDIVLEWSGNKNGEGYLYYGYVGRNTSPPVYIAITEETDIVSIDPRDSKYDYKSKSQRFNK